VKAAKIRCTEELKNLESPSARQRVQTEYEATLTNLHLALDKELDGIWAEFEECARDALARETQALERVECAQKACDLARGNCPRPAGVRRCAMRIALQKLDPNTANTEQHSNQGDVHGARAAMARQGEVDGLSEAAAAELSAAQAHHEKVLADAGWKLEKVVAGWLDAAALQQRRGQKPVVIPMLPPLLGLPYHQECSDVPLADEIRKAFDYQCTEEGKQEACAAFVALFCQQACSICPARKDPGLARGWPEDLEIAAGQIYAKWDTLITNKRVCREHEDACTWDEEFERPNFLEATAMEFLQKEVGALLQDCEDTREDVLQADESATEEAAEPTLAAAAAQKLL
jgi:hypothetical protein